MEVDSNANKFPLPAPALTSPPRPQSQSRTDGQSHLISAQTRRVKGSSPSALSCVAAALAIMLIGATAMFYSAGSNASDQMSWSTEVYDRAWNFCEDPSMTGIVAFLTGFFS